MQMKNLFPTPNSARLIVIALVLAVIGLFASLAQAQPAAGPRAAQGHGAMHDGPMGARMLDRALDSVDASADQRTRIHEIMKAAADDVHKQHEVSGGLR